MHLLRLFVKRWHYTLTREIDPLMRRGRVNPRSRTSQLKIFEVDLRIGLLIDKHTDFYLPGSIPIEFRRATRDGWKRPLGFGLSGTHNYDKFLEELAGMRRIKVAEEDGGGYELDRMPSWLPLLPFVKYVDAGTDRSGESLELRWRRSRFRTFRSEAVQWRGRNVSALRRRNPVLFGGLSQRSR